MVDVDMSHYDYVEKLTATWKIVRATFKQYGCDVWSGELGHQIERHIPILSSIFGGPVIGYVNVNTSSVKIQPSGLEHLSEMKAMADILEKQGLSITIEVL